MDKVINTIVFLTQNAGMVCISGYAFYAKEQDNIAANYFKRSLDVAKSLDFPSWEYSTIQRYSKLLGEMGRIADAHKLMKEYSVRKATKNRS